jgi:hypothetical protein
MTDKTVSIASRNKKYGIKRKQERAGKKKRALKAKRTPRSKKI